MVIMHVVRFYRSSTAIYTSYILILGFFGAEKSFSLLKQLSRCVTKHFVKYFHWGLKILLTFARCFTIWMPTGLLYAMRLGLEILKSGVHFFFTFTHRSMNYQNYYLHSKLTFVSTMNLDSHSRIEINPMLI